MGSTRPERIPLFPLNVVLLPGGDLPLHIFEPRYRRMVQDCIEAKSEFGMLLALPKGLVRVGCTAEVLDVANAVMDGTDAVMLSAETASGKHPVKVVEAMAQIIVGAEKYQLAHVRVRQRNSGYFSHTDEAIAAAVMYAANHLHVKAIVANPNAINRRESIPLFNS